jgi:hypothetical protein
MTHTNHRQIHVSTELQRIFDFIHRGCQAQEEVDKIIAESTPAKARAGGRGAAVEPARGATGKPGLDHGPSVAPPTSIGVNAGLQRRAGAPVRGPRVKGKHGLHASN